MTFSRSLTTFPALERFDTPVRLSNTDAPCSATAERYLTTAERYLTTAERYLTAEQCTSVFRRIVQLAREGDTAITLRSSWSGTTRWVRNKINASTDRSDQTVTITRIIRGARGSATTNQFDDRSLAVAIWTAERQVLRNSENADLDFVSVARTYLAPELFAQSTYNLLAAERSSTARGLVDPAVKQGLMSAGYIEARTDAIGSYDTKGLASHAVTTNAQYSVTVRTPDGLASGWAGTDHINWIRINAGTLSTRALEKCLASTNPFAIEPGRYTVVLEPQAVHELVRVALREQLMLRFDNEKYDTLPYNLRRAPRNGQGSAKFGMQLMDERITIETDPMDPDAAYLPFDARGIPYGKVKWIDEGVLRELPYDMSYALELLGSNVARPYTPVYRMSGGQSTLDEMIASTRRGILVTRFIGVQLLDERSILATGVTADGTWLIENGKISRAIKNLRFNVSPLHALYSVEALGVPQRVFSPEAPAVVPPLKISEFHFSSTTDVF